MALALHILAGLGWAALAPASDGPPWRWPPAGAFGGLSVTSLATTIAALTASFRVICASAGRSCGRRGTDE